MAFLRGRQNDTKNHEQAWGHVIIEISDLFFAFHQHANLLFFIILTLRCPEEITLWLNRQVPGDVLAFRLRREWLAPPVPCIPAWKSDAFAAIPTAGRAVLPPTARGAGPGPVARSYPATYRDTGGHPGA